MAKPINTNNVICGYVGPNQNSKTQLGGGVYSLSNRSNVPFVTLVGALGFQKTITWGEIVEIPDGMLVTVRNSSFHGGDIFLNKGDDRQNRPARITVPVEFVQKTVAGEEGNVYQYFTAYPCDTRGARRAYLCVDALVKQVVTNPATGLTVFVRGRRLDGSMQTANSLSKMPAPFGPAVGFLNALNYADGDNLVYIPLGQGAADSDDTRPHNLLDAGDVMLIPNALSALTDFLTWPADVNVNGFPVMTGATSQPGAWYVIEY